MEGSLRGQHYQVHSHTQGSPGLMHARTRTTASPAATAGPAGSMPRKCLRQVHRFSPFVLHLCGASYAHVHRQSPLCCSWRPHPGKSRAEQVGSPGATGCPLQPAAAEHPLPEALPALAGEGQLAAVLGSPLPRVTLRQEAAAWVCVPALPPDLGTAVGQPPSS